MAQSTTISMDDFIQQHGITMSYKPVDTNPHMDTMGPSCHHWYCTLKMGHKRMSTYFSQGEAWTTPPTAADVLDCLASDSAGTDMDFESWASDYGYSEDSRKAEQTYKACQREAHKLQRFLGDDFTTLIYDVER